jgi:hypothetical protein
MECNLEKQASIIYNIRDLKLKRVPWLYDLTGFLYHLTTLKDKEI